MDYEINYSCVWWHLAALGFQLCYVGHFLWTGGMCVENAAMDMGQACAEDSQLFSKWAGAWQS